MSDQSYCRTKRPRLRIALFLGLTFFIANTASAFGQNDLYKDHKVADAVEGIERIIALTEHCTFYDKPFELKATLAEKMVTVDFFRLSPSGLAGPVPFLSVRTGLGEKTKTSLVKGNLHENRRSLSGKYVLAAYKNVQNKEWLGSEFQVEMSHEGNIHTVRFTPLPLRVDNWIDVDIGNDAKATKVRNPLSL